MATDAQSLLSAAVAAGYEGKSSNPYGLELIKLGLLQQLLLKADPMADTSANALLNVAKCYECYGANNYMLRLMELALLQLLVNSGGGGGNVNACLVAQSGGPVAACAFAFGIGYDNDSTSPTAGQFWFWDLTGNAWVKFSI